MAVVTVPVRVSPSRRGIRSLDPLRDLPTVVDLIELGFEEELGPQGLKMLEQMQKAAHPNPYTRLFSSTDTDLPGYVWEENGHVVANLSLRRASASRQHGWIIGNVVVHPDFRGCGIGRALMEAAMDTVRARHGRWIGLEVRTSNRIARTLYKHLGFRDVGQTTHMMHSEDTTWPKFAPPSSRAWRRSRSEDKQRWAQLATSIYHSLQQRILEIHPARYDFGGLDRKLLLWLRREREKAWVQSTGRPKRAVRVRTDRRRRFHLWDLLVHPAQPWDGAREAVALAISVLGSKEHWPVVTTVEIHAPVVPILESLGFHHHRTLAQMYYELR